MDGNNRKRAGWEKACKAALFGADRRGNERVRLKRDWWREAAEGGERERGREGDKECEEQMVAGSQSRSKSSQNFKGKSLEHNNFILPSYFVCTQHFVAQSTFRYVQREAEIKWV